MRAISKRKSAALVLSLFTAPVVAQSTWTVTQISGAQAAINAASPGDTILLQGQPYFEPFVVNKGVTIRGDGVYIGRPWPTLASAEVLVNVPAGQRAHLDGLFLAAGYLPLGVIGGHLSVTGGAVTVQRCHVLCGDGDAVRVGAGAKVVLESCLLHGNGAAGVAGRGLTVQAGAHVEVRDSSVLGCNAIQTPYSSVLLVPQPAVEVTAATVRMERTTCVGGGGAASGTPGLVVHGVSSITLADCAVAGGIGNGSSALVNNGAVPVELSNTTLTPGASSAPASVGAVNNAAPSCRLAIAPELQRGTTSNFTMRADANGLFGLLLAFDLAPSPVGLVAEPIWCANGVLITAGLLDASGVTTMSVNVPSGPALQNVAVWCQAVGGTTWPLHASTLGGGLIL